MGNPDLLNPNREGVFSQTAEKYKTRASHAAKHFRGLVACINVQIEQDQESSLVSETNRTFGVANNKGAEKFTQ